MSSVGASRAVFLDRDGVINRPLVHDGKPYPPASLREFEILPDVAEACARLKAAGLLLVVATNQPDVGRGTLSQEAVEAIHNFMLRQLPIDRVDVCYHPGKGESECDCRKPRPGMLTRASRELRRSRCRPAACPRATSIRSACSSRPAALTSRSGCKRTASRR